MKARDACSSMVGYACFLLLLPIACSSTHEPPLAAIGQATGGGNTGGNVGAGGGSGGQQSDGGASGGQQSEGGGSVGQAGPGGAAGGAGMSSAQGGSAGGSNGVSCPPPGYTSGALMQGRPFDVDRGCVGGLQSVPLCGCLQGNGKDSSTLCLVDPDAHAYFVGTADGCAVALPSGWFVDGAVALVGGASPTSAQSTACAILRASSTAKGTYDRPGPPTCDGAGAPPIAANLCPSDLPAAGAACSQWLTCTYGNDPRLFCREARACSLDQGGAWTIPSPYSCPAQGKGGCPMEPPVPGTSCSPSVVPNGGCRFGDTGACACEPCAVDGCSADGGTWACAQPPASPDCPASPPNLGTPCAAPNGTFCDYGPFSLNPILMICAASVWRL